MPYAQELAPPHHHKDGVAMTTDIYTSPSLQPTSFSPRIDLRGLVVCAPPTRPSLSRQQPMSFHVIRNTHSIIPSGRSRSAALVPLRFIHVHEETRIVALKYACKGPTGSGTNWVQAPHSGSTPETAAARSHLGGGRLRCVVSWSKLRPLCPAEQHRPALKGCSVLLLSNIRDKPQSRNVRAGTSEREQAPSVDQRPPRLDHRRSLIFSNSPSHSILF
ncbi:hypothetical protein D4764_19G0003630 [Takifugu flavidus]|uniref:Uncharacterized protein n=1 Tax=Takifugu flavidus TaxID=433684 RepID=A0A5C6NNU8_9TELE|nr:hypothetical protein D4764_19G0003630 [Takifugu flavidus]